HAPHGALEQFVIACHGSLFFFGMRTAVAVWAHGMRIAWRNVWGIIPLDRLNRESAPGHS
ncbi:MAG: hypothetical protein WAV67_04950, partial [Dokdonella sp.]